MSGKREATITISEEEYRRLHDVDMRQRFARDANDVEQDYRQRVQALDQQIKDLQHTLAKAQKRGAVPEALRQRLQIASRLIRALQQTGYHQAGYDFADSDRKTVLLRMVRASDGSQMTVAVGQDPALFWAWAGKVDQSGKTLPLDNDLANAIVVRGGNG